MCYDLYESYTHDIFALPEARQLFAHYKLLNNLNGCCGWTRVREICVLAAFRTDILYCTTPKNFWRWTWQFWRKQTTNKICLGCCCYVYKNQVISITIQLPLHFMNSLEKHGRNWLYIKIDMLLFSINNAPKNICQQCASEWEHVNYDLMSKRITPEKKCVLYDW